MAKTSAHTNWPDRRNGGAPVRPDRPIPVDQADHRSTPERLLDAAEHLFAEHGFADTSVRDLTAAADCNVASVNYHFGSKDNLYLEMFRRAIGEMREHRLNAIREAMAAADVSLGKLVRAFCDSFIEPIIADPARGDRLMQLYSREMAQPLLPEDMFHREMFEPISQATDEALRQIYPAITFQQTMMILLSVGGQLVHLVQMMRCLRQAGSPMVDQIDLRDAVDHIVAFSVAGIEATVDSSAKGSA